MLRIPETERWQSWQVGGLGGLKVARLALEPVYTTGDASVLGGRVSSVPTVPWRVDLLNAVARCGGMLLRVVDLGASSERVYEQRLLLTGYPGTTLGRGGLGWGSVGLLRSQDRVVLVDTGGPNSQPPLLAALTDAGVEAGEVTDVLLTHCHWDHLGNVTLFPNARLVVPGQELAWARRQPPGTWQLADLHVEWLTGQHSRLVEVADGDEPVPGVVVVATPGHTPGHVAYHAVGASARLYAGDAVKNRAELVTGEVDMTLDASSSRESIERVRDLLAKREDLLLMPGHDVPMRLDGGELALHGHAEAVITAQLSPDGTGAPVGFDLSDRLAGR